MYTYVAIVSSYIATSLVASKYITSYIEELYIVIFKLRTCANDCISFRAAASIAIRTAYVDDSAYSRIWFIY